MDNRRWVGSRKCSEPGCEVHCWRFCRVCGRWICRNHRNGVGWLFRCLSCPAEALAEISRADRQREKDHRELEQLLDERAGSCAWCFAPFTRRGVALTPACQCHLVRSAREVFAGL